MLYGEAYQAFLDLRAAKPTGSLFLDLQSAEARAGRDEMAEKYRERTAYELIGERIQEWFDTPISGREIVNPGTDLFDDEQVGDKWFLRNVISAKEAFLALRSDPELSTYKNADVRTFGRAIMSVIRTSPLPCHRQSQGPIRNWLSEFSNLCFYSVAKLNGDHNGLD